MHFWQNHIDKDGKWEAICDNLKKLEMLKLCSIEKETEAVLSNLLHALTKIKNSFRFLLSGI